VVQGANIKGQSNCFDGTEKHNAMKKKLTPTPCGLRIRPGVGSDSLCLGVLATQVFLDTYATHGINADLANEALQVYSSAAFEVRMATPQIEITVAEADSNLVGFLDLQADSTCPISTVAGPEVRRLYVQSPFQRKGLGRKLLEVAEARVHRLGASSIWLTAWVGNPSALAFYPAVGYVDVGTTEYVINGKSYENRVFAKALRSVQ